MSIPKRIVELVLNRDGHRCTINAGGCLIQASCADHRVGRGMGGNEGLNVAEALVAACGLCNGRREDDADLAADLERRGIKILRSQSTKKDLVRCRNLPVTYPDGRVWFLLPDGRRQELTEVPF